MAAAGCKSNSSINSASQEESTPAAARGVEPEAKPRNFDLHPLLTQGDLQVDPETLQPYTGRVFWLHEGTQVVSGEYSLRRGRRHGLWTKWHENGQKSAEGEYRDGEKIGRWTGWHENGQRKLQGEFRDGKQHGLWTFWHENGQKKDEGEWQDGKRQGLFTFWHENGQKESEGEFRDDKEHGPWTEWHANGQVSGQGRYVNGYAQP